MPLRNDLTSHIRQIVAAYYWAAYSLHHKLFLRPGRPLKNSKLIVIGSFRAGGAGKTPFCLWLAKHMASRGKQVAILCHTRAYDEVRMYREHLKEFIQQGQMEVIETMNRYRTAQKLDRGIFPTGTRTAGRTAETMANSKVRTTPDFILCDDGFEDSRLRPDAIFRLDWEKAPTDVRQLVPAGMFRSLLQDHAQDLERTSVLRCYGANPDVVFRIDSISNSTGEFPKHKQTIAVCGLGDPERFIQDLKKAELTVQKKIFRPDHDIHFRDIFSAILREHCEENIVISEKDSFRLTAEQINDPRVYIARQAVDIRKTIVI